MSEDVAFTSNEQQDDVFQFDEVKDTSEESTGADSATSEDKQETVSGADEAEESRVPYTRFKKKEEELAERESQIQSLEERLAELESRRTESQAPDEIDLPREWVDLYGDSDAAKRAYLIQVKREEQLQENAVKKALQQFRDESYQQERQVEENETIIDDELENLQEYVGKKFSAQTEEAILSIVDEFSPTGSDGKYISVFPFDKAYEIYELRNSKAQQKTIRARNQVADLTGANSSGEIENADSTRKKGWDSWRDAL